MYHNIILSIIYLFVGSYSAPSDEGVRVYTFDTETAQTNYLCGAKGISNPGFLCLSADGRRVYAVGEDPDATTATANSLLFNPRKGTLQLTSSQPAHGGAPSNIALSPNGRFVVTANYYSGSITSYRVDGKGRLGLPSVYAFTGSSVHPKRQTHPYLHGVYYTPDGKHLWCTDLGTDLLRTFSVDSHGIPQIDSVHQTDHFTKSMLGPRHICFSPNRPLAYLLGEISGEVCTLDFSQSDHVRVLQAVRCDSLNAEGSADIHISPDGRFVYASHRLKGDGLSILRVDSDGTLTKIGYQPTAAYPRNFAISPDGRFLLVASRDEDVIQVFRRDLATGFLTDTEQRIPMHNPSCLKFYVPKGGKEVNNPYR